VLKPAIDTLVSTQHLGPIWTNPNVGLKM